MIWLNPWIQQSCKHCSTIISWHHITYAVNTPPPKHPKVQLKWELINLRCLVPELFVTAVIHKMHLFCCFQVAAKWLKCQIQPEGLEGGLKLVQARFMDQKHEPVGDEMIHLPVYLLELDQPSVLLSAHLSLYFLFLQLQIHRFYADNLKIDVIQCMSLNLTFF